MQLCDYVVEVAMEKLLKISGGTEWVKKNYGSLGTKSLEFYV